MTEKQKRFADYYIELGNATESYIRAGYKCSSRSVAEANARKLLGNYSVKEYIDKKLVELSSERIANATEVMEYLTCVMRREHKEIVVVTLNEETSMYVPDENGTMRKQTVKREVPDLVEIPAKLSDANKAAELLGKRYSLFTDKLKIEGSVGVQIVDDIGG